jgi:hypothetical protein
LSFQDADINGYTPVGLAIVLNKTNMAMIMIKAAKTLEELGGICDDKYDDYAYCSYPNLHFACIHGRLEIVNTIFEAEKTLTKTEQSEVCKGSCTKKLCKI